jgi:hypothetical protein
MTAILRLHDLAQTLQDLKFGYQQMTEDAVATTLEDAQRELQELIKELTEHE